MKQDKVVKKQFTLNQGYVIIHMYVKYWNKGGYYSLIKNYSYKI